MGGHQSRDVQTVHTDLRFRTGRTRRNLLRRDSSCCTSMGDISGACHYYIQFNPAKKNVDGILSSRVVRDQAQRPVANQNPETSTPHAEHRATAALPLQYIVEIQHALIGLPTPSSRATLREAVGIHSCSLGTWESSSRPPLAAPYPRMLTPGQHLSARLVFAVKSQHLGSCHRRSRVVFTRAFTIRPQRARGRCPPWARRSTEFRSSGLPCSHYLCIFHHLH